MSLSRKDEALDVARMCHITASNMSIMDFEGLGTEYYQDDSDKEYDIPIDPVWEAQQMRTFTAWCNAHLRKANMKIEVFDQDFRNGLRLMKLLEIISNNSLPPPDKGKMRFHKIANVNKALKFIEDKGVKLASVGAEEIVDGNIKMTLGMIWTIILRFAIQDIHVEDSTAKEGLLLWCKRKTNGYKNVRVDNFKTSFQNGLAFCALIHSHDSELLDFDSLSPKNLRHNLDLAFSMADKYLDVPQMLSVEDMINNDHSDERSIMTYVSSYYHAFNRRDKINTALTDINNIITSRMEEDSCVLNYDKVAVNLLQWIEKMTKEFEDRKDIDDNSEMTSKIKSFEQYKFTDKPKNMSNKMKLLFGVIQSVELKEKEQQIRSKWYQMEKLEFIYEKHLSEQRQREEHKQNLLNKFEINFQVQRAWISNQIDRLISKDYETSSLSELRTMSRLQGTFLANVGSQQTRTEKIVSISDELRRLHYKDMKTIDEKVDIIVSPWDTLGSLNDQRVQSINTYLNALLKVEDLQLEFAKKVIPLYNWIQQANQDLNDKFVLHFIEEIKDLIIAQKRFKKTVDEALEELNNVKSLNDQICKIIKSTGIQKIPLNPYTEITINDVQKAWLLLERSIPERDHFLQKSLEQRISITECHSDYKSKAEKIFSNLSDIQKTLLDKVSSRMNTDKKVDTLKTLREKVNALTIPIRELGLIYQKLDQYNKMDNSKTMLSYEQIVATRDTLEYLIMETMKLTSQDHTDASMSNNSLRNNHQDYEACFRHFDKNNFGHLDPIQFHACLMSLGFAIEDYEKQDKSLDNLMIEVDPDHTGLVSLTMFLDFMSRQNDNKCSSERLLESFKVLSNNQMWINRDTLRQELPSSVANYCIANMQPYISSSGDNENNMDYNDFVRRMYHGRRPSIRWNGSM